MSDEIEMTEEVAVPAASPAKLNRHFVLMSKRIAVKGGSALYRKGSFYVVPEAHLDALRDAIVPEAEADEAVVALERELLENREREKEERRARAREADERRKKKDRERAQARQAARDARRKGLTDGSN